MTSTRICLIVPQAHVKRIKTVLEKQEILDRSIKIQPEINERDGTDCKQSRMVIPTTFQTALSLDSEDPSTYLVELETQKFQILKNLGLEHVIGEVTVSIRDFSKSSAAPAVSGNPVSSALVNGLQTLPKDLLEALELTPAVLADAFPSTYSVYPPMLLLPSHAFDNAPWRKLSASLGADSPALQPVWKCLAESVKQTHVAINAGIPLNRHSQQGDVGAVTDENILRSPINMTPLYGDFGPLPTPERIANPTEQDFKEALWVTATQNGIQQVWAPVYTMFSRGNIREKTRILNLPSVKAAALEHSASTAVDLYAGIGYFAFSYRGAGISTVLCWELNPWSIEGLRRGAEKNGWNTQVIPTGLGFSGNSTSQRYLEDRPDFLIFQQNNEYAAATITALTQADESIPPVRHVNCGFLPSSRGSWQTSVQIIDVQLGGWIHAHENVAVHDIEARSDKIVDELQAYLDAWDTDRGADGMKKRRIRCEHMEKVKTYAPGVVHVVFDLRVEGYGENADQTE